MGRGVCTAHIKLTGEGGPEGSRPVPLLRLMAAGPTIGTAGHPLHALQHDRRFACAHQLLRAAVASLLFLCRCECALAQPQHSPRLESSLQEAPHSSAVHCCCWPADRCCKCALALSQRSLRLQSSYQEAHAILALLQEMTAKCCLEPILSCRAC